MEAQLFKKPSKRTTEGLYKMVAKYLLEAGGSAAVVGGVSIMKHPTDLKFNYHLVISVTGKSPIKTDE